MIFLLTIALGGAVLWHFESRRKDEARRNPVDVDPIAPAVEGGIDGTGEGPGGVEFPGAGGPDAGTPDGGTPGAGTSGDGAEEFIRPGEFIRMSGPQTSQRPRQTEDGARLHIRAEDSETMNRLGTALRLIGVVGEAYVLSPATEREVLRTRLNAESGLLELEEGAGGAVMSGALVEVDLEEVVVEQLRETPLAPLIIEAPRMNVHFIDEEIRSLEKDLVTFRSRDLRGWGRALVADTESGRLEFNDGADVTIDLGETEFGDSLVAHIQTPEGGTLRLIEEAPDDRGRRIVRVIAREGVHAEIRDERTSGASGDDARPGLTLDAKSLDAWVVFEDGAEEPHLQRVRADGAVRIRRERDTYEGDTALLKFDARGEPESVVLEDEPRLTYGLVDADGVETEVTVSGLGPLTGYFLGLPDEDGGAERQARFEFLGPGRIEAVDRLTDVTFRAAARGRGVPGSDEAAVSLEGDVRLVAPEGTLSTERVDLRQSADGTLRVVAESPTRITHRDVDAGEDHRFIAQGRLSGRLTDDGWFVDEAERVFAESLGDEPYRVEAGRVEDVDIRRGTLHASTDVVYRTALGAAYAPLALVREEDTVRLVGTAEDPVELHFTPEDRELELDAADAVGVRTGFVFAPEVTLSREGVSATGGVAASLETLDGVFSIDCDALDVDREVTGASFEDAGDPTGVGALVPRAGEIGRFEARVVREARYDAADASAVFTADRLEVDAPLVEALGEDGGSSEGVDVDPFRETVVRAFGSVVGHMETYLPGDPAAPDAPREVVETLDFRMADMTFVRGVSRDPGAPAKDSEAPFRLTGETVEEFRLESEGRLFEIDCAQIEVDGEFGPARMPDGDAEIGPDGERPRPDLTGSTLVARGDVDLVFRAAPDEPQLTADGESLVIVDGERGTLSAAQGQRVRASGTMPRSDIPYELFASRLDFSETTLEGELVEVVFARNVRTAGTGIPIKEAKAPRMYASETAVVLEGTDEDRVWARTLDESGLGGILRLRKITIDPQALREDENGGEEAADDADGGAPMRSVRPFEPVSPPAAPQGDEQDEQDETEPIQIEGPLDFEGDDGLKVYADQLARTADGRTVTDELTAILPGGQIDLDLRGLTFDIEMFVSPQEGKDYLIEADRGAIRGYDDARGLPWSFEFASLDMEAIDDEILVTIVAPRITVGQDYARADYIAFWVDRARWRAKIIEMRRGTPVPDTFPGDEARDAVDDRPSFLAELLFEVKSERYGRYIRALFMEGGVEIARADERAAKGTRLYLGLDDGVAWLEDAELVYPLQTRGEEVPLRVRTERLETDETGRLIADGATLTTCDHDVPHFVVRTNQFRLEPREDKRWRFNATGNRLQFQGGWQLPLPGIGNVVLDEEFGVEGFENEAGEVTPLSDIGIARTARFGTVLGAAFRFDTGAVGRWIGERIGMDTSKISGKWDTEAQYLASRGPLVGLGLSLREREPGDDPDEDFRLDAFVTGIPDDGADRGTVRVPESERDTGRFWGWIRSRYPIVRGEWLDVAVASQTDAGVQPEFYEGEFLRFEQRDTFVRWRKSYGADYLTSGLQKRIDDFRSQKEELPSFLAYRGEREIGVLGGTPLLWGGAFETGYFTRREGEEFRDIFSDLPGGAARGVGDFETARADLVQRVSMPFDTGTAGLRITPFVEGRGTAWSNDVADEGDPARAAMETGVELSTTLHKVTRDGYLHALAPRLSASKLAAYEESGGAPVPLDQVERRPYGDRLEAGLRAIWLRPRTFENLDFDLRATRIQSREDGLDDTTRFGALAQWITRYGDGEGQFGLSHDARYDAESGDTVYSRSALAWKPNDEFLAEIRYGQALAFDEQSELFETGAFVTRTRLDPKWEVEGRYVWDLQNDEHLLTEFTLRRFAHDFVFDLTFQDRAGEGGTNLSFSLLPLLGWTRDRLGLLDQQR